MNVNCQLKTSPSKRYVCKWDGCVKGSNVCRWTDCQKSFRHWAMVRNHLKSTHFRPDFLRDVRENQPSSSNQTSESNDLSKQASVTSQSENSFSDFILPPLQNTECGPTENIKLVNSDPSPQCHNKSDNSHKESSSSDPLLVDNEAEILRLKNQVEVLTNEKDKLHIQNAELFDRCRNLQSQIESNVCVICMDEKCLCLAATSFVVQIVLQKLNGAVFVDWKSLGRFECFIVENELIK
uniref:C2H2-type domain-containing protein n=1 Tax=Acrobeloides nanus TaxID=290746 RepID=A0A914DI07_9BILA